MIYYTTDTNKVAGLFSLSYRSLRLDYRNFVSMSDEEFLSALPKALHFACIVGWLKELGEDATIGDEGIVHELVHLLEFGLERWDVAKVREQFNRQLELV